MKEDLIKKYDQACKNLISKRPVIAYLCKHTIEELKGYSVEEVQTLFKEVDTGENRELEDKRLDYKNTITLPDGKQLTVEVEIQNDEYPGYSLYNRAVYYSSLLITTQVIEKSNYDSLKKVYSLWLMPHSSLKKDGLITKTHFVTESLTHHKDIHQTDKQVIIMIYLCDQHDINIPYEEYDRLLMPLLLMFTRNTNEDQVKHLLEDEYGIKGIEKEVKEMCNLGEGLARRYEQQGLQQGKQQGIQEGLQQGKQEATVNSIKEIMKKLNYTFDQACDLLGIDHLQKDLYKDLLLNQ